MKSVFSSIGCAFLISACASPLVKYDKVTPKDISGRIKFQIAESVIKFDWPMVGEGQNAVPDTTKLTISSIPVANDETTYTLEGTSWYENWGVSTDITATRIGDTQLLKQVGSKITDQRVSLIGQGASIASTAIGLGLFGAGGVITTPAVTTLPAGLSIEKILSEVSNYCGKNANRDDELECKDLNLIEKSGSDSGYVAGLTIGKVPTDAFRVSEWPYKQGTALYSACRTLRIVVRNKSLGDGWSAEASLVIADPTWFQSLKLPQNGKVILGDSCGAESAADSYAGSSPADYLKALSDAAKTIKDALKAKNSSGASSSK